MKRALWIPVILLGCFSLFPQQVAEESVVINIEVRVPAKDFRVIHRLGYFAE